MTQPSANNLNPGTLKLFTTLIISSHPVTTPHATSQTAPQFKNKNQNPDTKPNQPTTMPNQNEDNAGIPLSHSPDGTGYRLVELPPDLQQQLEREDAPT